jgi:hypothetical protein
MYRIIQEVNERIIGLVPYFTTVQILPVFIKTLHTFIRISLVEEFFLQIKYNKILFIVTGNLISVISIFLIIAFLFIEHID